MEILNPRHMRKKSDINHLNSHSDVNQREIPLASDILGFIIQSLTSDFHSGFFLFKKVRESPVIITTASYSQHGAAWLTFGSGWPPKIVFTLNQSASDFSTYELL